MASEFDERFEAKRRGEEVREEPLGRQYGFASTFTVSGAEFEPPTATFADLSETFARINGYSPGTFSNLPPGRVSAVGPNGKRAITVDGEELVERPALPPREPSL